MLRKTDPEFTIKKSAKKTYVLEPRDQIKEIVFTETPNDYKNRPLTPQKKHYDEVPKAEAKSQGKYVNPLKHSTTFNDEHVTPKKLPQKKIVHHKESLLNLSLTSMIERSSLNQPNPKPSVSPMRRKEDCKTWRVLGREVEQDAIDTKKEKRGSLNKTSEKQNPITGQGYDVKNTGKKKFQHPQHSKTESSLYHNEEQSATPRQNLQQDPVQKTLKLRQPHKSSSGYFERLQMRLQTKR